MKRLITSIILLVITVSACIAETIFLNNTVSSFSQDIDNAMQEASNENLDSAMQIADDISNRWQEQQPFISTFINHERLEEIAQSIISMKTNLFKGQTEDFFVESEIAKTQFNDLKDTEFPSIENIL